MRRTFVIIASILTVITTMYSKQVSLETARRVAVNWMIERTDYSVNHIKVSKVTSIAHDSLVVYYIVNMLPDGFLIVAAEDNVVPIIMYAKEGSFDNTRVPSSLDYMLRTTEFEIYEAAQNGVQPASEVKLLWQRLDVEKTSFKKVFNLIAVIPFLKTTWDQVWTYNKFCPATTSGGSGGHVYTGCVATAMAQVMNYYKRPIRGTGSNSYTDPSNPATQDPGYGTLSVDFSTTAYDWKNMPKYLSGSSSTISIDAVATLMYHCGVSVNMDYGPQGSGAMMFRAVNALVNNFRYNSQAALVNRSAYSSSDWTTLMVNELNAARPIIYSGNDVNTGAAHAFIFDGYEGTNYFHVHWGWGGSADGYFYMSSLTPGNSNHASNQAAIIKIIPLDWAAQTPTTTKNFKAIKAVDKNVVWICGDKGIIHRTANGGESWTKSPFTDSLYNLCAIEAIDAATVWVVGNKGSNNAKLWKTTDGGNSWAAQFSSTNQGASFNAVRFYDSSNGIITGDPENDKYVVLTTTNGGSTWTKTPDANIPDPQQGEKGFPNNLVILGNNAWFGTGGGQWLTRVYRSSNRGANWNVSQVVNGLDINLVSTSFATDMNGWILGANGGIMKSTDGGNKWSSAITTGALQGGGIQHLGGSVIAMAGGRGGFFLSADNGDTWTAKPITGIIRRINALSFSSGENGWVAGDSGAIAQWIGSALYMPPPQAPTLLSPNDDAVDVPSNSTLSWNDVSSATSFRIQISTASDFSTIAFDSSGITNTSCTTNKMLSNTLYYWRVNASNTGGTSAWSGAWKFTTTVAIPNSPALASPASGATGVQKNVTLTWNASQDATSYWLQVYYKISNINYTVVDQSGITATSFDVTGLANNTTYYWQVKAVNKAGSSNWSTTWTFTTIMGPPNTPLLTAPANGAQGVSVTPTLNWTGASGATSYQLQVSTNSSFTTTAIDKSGLTLASYTASGLSNNTTYYWRVNASNVGGTSSWSNVWSFTTAATPPAVPTLISPANGATGIITNPTLNWNASSGAITYRLQVSIISTFPTTILDTTLSTTTKTIIGLMNNLTYYWRVNATNKGGTSAWSTIWNFMTVVAPPSIPIPISPLDGAVGVQINPTITWNAASGATAYHLQVSTSSSFTTNICDTNVTTTSFAMSSLSNNSIYYWRVNASNAGGTSVWSNVCRFTTVPSTPVERLGNSSPNEFSLGQNYPNPFGASSLVGYPSTTISFSLAEKKHIRLKVYDIFMRDVATLLNEERDAGYFNVTFNAHDLPSGMYFYRLEAGTFTKMRKMNLVR